MNRTNNLLIRPLRAVLRGLFLSAFSFLLVPDLAAETVEVEIYKYQYHPKVVQVRVGDTVRWVNRERRQYHSVQLHRDGSDDESLDSGYLFPQEQWEQTFTQLGRYSYLCGPHPDMSGRVEVVE